MTLLPHDSEQLDDLAAEFTARLRRGEEPSVAEYLQRLPALAEQLQSLLETIGVLERARETFRQAEAEQSQLLPERLGDCRVRAEIGRGGMGIVYEAFQESLGRKVAVKTLSPALAADPLARKRFLREAKAAAAVVHPHVVTIHAVAEEHGTPYLVME